MLVTRVLLLSLILSFNVKGLQIKNQAPDQYVVVSGDTLWDIATLYLNDPWRWPELWGDNPHIANPHLIFPGDVLTLTLINGQPRLQKSKRFRALSPAIKKKHKPSPISAFSLEQLAPYINHNIVVLPKQLDQQTTVVLAAQRLAKHYYQGDLLYADGKLVMGNNYGIYHPQKVFTNNGEQIGVELALAATAKAVAIDKFNTLQVTSVYQEFSSGAVLLPLEQYHAWPLAFQPYYSNHDGLKVLGHLGNIREAGKYDISYINAGSNQQLKSGAIFTVKRQGSRIITSNTGEPISHINQSSYQRLLSDSLNKGKVMPAEPIAIIMVLRAFDNVSMVIVLQAGMPIRAGDKLAHANETFSRLVK
ncbi:LysM peptidoglycan-binding domain-containing protein [Paraferrimonas sp. SM1919]|uniref:LysM peptidoglycan-binding domain-containing protein n=1 Tax=Paraferrimonas sp. SM1919 TaxID=2662263 RepID=UPI0013D080F8|nr:LysM domain-containing protein [Paraferrimonas sp. SM1919]